MVCGVGVIEPRLKSFTGLTTVRAMVREWLGAPVTSCVVIVML